MHFHGSEDKDYRRLCQAYRAGKSPLILISGGNAFDSKHPPESALAARLLIDWGIPPAAALNNSGLALKEYLGLLAYRLRNWA